MTHETRPFLLITTRGEDHLAQAERDAFARLGELGDDELHWLRLEQEEEVSRQLAALDLDAYSGVILGGSPFNATTPQQDKSAAQVRCELSLGELLDRVIADEVPFFGACYGVGTLGLHQGGIVDRTYGELVEAAEITLTEEGVADPLLEGFPAVFHAFVGHKEAIAQLPPHAVWLARGRNCPYQMFRVGPCAYATQFHPELEYEGLITRLETYQDHGYFEPGSFATIKERLRQGPDVGVASTMLAAFTRRFRRAA